jgi:non-specific serine/threonine protein kinase
MELAARLDDDRHLLADRLERMAVEYGNIRHALDWAAGEDPGLEAELVVSLRWFWLIRGAVREACQAVGAAVVKRQMSAELRAAVHRDAALWSLHAGDIRTARAHANEAALLLDMINDPVLEASVLSARGAASAHEDAGERDLERARALLEPTDERELLARVLNNLVLLRLRHGRASEALALAEQAVPAMAALHDRSGVVPHWLHTYGAVLLAVGRIDDARDRFVEGLAQSVRFGNYAMAASLVKGLACVAAAAGDPALCLELAAAGRRLGHLAGVPDFDDMWTSTAPAERASEAALSTRAAARAREVGAALDMQAALRHAQTRRSAEPPAPLTPRKREIVRLVTQGLTNRAIARRLTISERTVDAHLEQVRNQLGLSNRAQIATWAAVHLDHS